MGKPPERMGMDMKEGVLQNGGSVKEGEVEVDVDLLIATSPQTRVDWFVTPKRANPDDVTLLPLDIATSVLNNIVHRWLPSLEGVNRLALGGVLLIYSESRQSSYELLARFLPAVTLDAKGSENFFYQINRPRLSKSGVPDLYVNRLTKWSVTASTKVKVALNVASIGKTTQYLHPSNLAHSATLELDINTSPALEGELGKQFLPKLADELFGLAAEVIDKGDIA